MPTKSSTSVAPRAPRTSRTSAAESPVPVERRLGTRLERALPRPFAQIDGDDPGRGELAQELHRDVAKTADADHHHRRSWNEAMSCALDRVIRRQRGVRQRRGGDRVEVADRHQQPRRGTSRYSASPPSKPSPQPAPAARSRRSQRFSAPAAHCAAACRIPRARRRAPHRLRRRPTSATERGDPAGALVPERERKLPGHRSLRPLHHVEIGVAQARRHDLDEHLARAGLGHLDVAELGLRLPAERAARAFIGCGLALDGNGSRIAANFRSAASRRVGTCSRRDAVLRRGRTP